MHIKFNVVFVPAMGFSFPWWALVKVVQFKWLVGMKKRTKDKMVIIACVIGSLIAALDIAVAVIDLVLWNMGRETILF